MDIKYYHLLVNRNFSVKKHYETFVLTHPHLHSRFRLVSWSYLIWLNVKFNLLHQEDKKKLRFGNESGTGFQKSPEVFAEELCGYDTVSFDMFDTLVFRPFSAPTDLFYAVGQEFGIMDFRSLRIRAEREARERCQAEKGHSEITLADICRILSMWTGVPAQELAECECRMEETLCLPNLYMREVWNRLTAAGKRIVITTDMYLPRETLEKMLEKCGFTGYANLFLSCEYGFGKYNLSLYEEVKKFCGQDKIVHIGDTLGADYANARKMGLDAVLYPNLNSTGTAFRTEDMSWMAGSAYRGLVNRRMYCMPETYSPAWEFGYKYGGILVTGFCRFIHAQMQQQGADRVLFFARDGYIVKQIYDRMYPEDKTFYVRWSRAAAAKLCAELYPYDYFRRFIDQKMNKGIPVKEILEAMELSGMKVSLPETAVLTDGTAAALKEELYSRLPEIGSRYAGMYAGADAFLRKILDGSSHALTVDCGWAGSGSVLLGQFVRRKMQMPVKITGLLAAANALRQLDSDFSETFFRDGQLKAYCFSAEHNRNAYTIHYPARSHNVYFELLFGAPEPSFLGFSENGLEFDSESENEAFIREVHAGEIAFAEDWEAAFSTLPYMQEISGSDAYAPFLSMIGGDGNEYLKMIFRDCVFDETVSGKKEKITG